MIRRYVHFIRGIAINWYGTIGVVLVTSSFVTFLILVAASFVGIFTNQYMGLLTFLFLPFLFVAGLVFIPFGWIVHKRKSGLTYRDIIRQQFSDDDVAAREQGSPLFLTIVVLSLLNILFLSGASVQTLHFMDKPKFCGTACHTVMNPEWVVYQDSPHAHVPCVECHVGEGIDALVSSKLEGARQMFLETFNLYHSPIPTPVKQLRPARETCEKCHWPAKFYGTRIKSSTHFDSDLLNTPSYTTLNLKIDTGTNEERAGIHWHVAPENELRYQTIDDKRQIMLWVEVKQQDGLSKRFSNTSFTEQGSHGGEQRVLDCVDCHNRATHIYEKPEQSINRKIDLNTIKRTLPFIKREGLRALTIEYPDRTSAMNGIRNHIQGFYQRHPTSVDLDSMEQAIETLQQIYDRNIHHYMNITWHTYPSHLGHPSETTGCFRCHNQNMINGEGKAIKHDCTLCHSILADHSPVPFFFLQAADKKDPDYIRHLYLQNEFLSSLQ